MGAYSYHRLPDPTSWIRVLVLEPGDHSSPLQASIEQELLNDEPLFDAISYCWGDAQRPHKITIRVEAERYTLAITDSLYLALRRFRSAFAKRRLWTDGICINQKDNEEKSDQVRLMAKIYRAARKVLIYLGEQDPSTPAALKLLKRIYAAALRTPQGDTRVPMQWIDDNKLPTITQSWKWESVKAFYRRPWFRRKWIIQECVMARRPVFHLGDWEEEWNFMAIVHSTITEKGLGVVDYTTSTNPEMAQNLQQGLSQLSHIGILRDTLAHGRKLELMDLALLFQTSRASDPRDHLFALLGLACDVGDGSLNPCYGESEDESLMSVCIRYAHHFLRKRGDLHVLYRAGLQGQKLLAPSWVPDWYGGHDGLGHETANGIWDPLQRPRFYNISGDTIPALLETTNKKILGLRGTIIGTIAELANAHLPLNTFTWDKERISTQRRLHLEQADVITFESVSHPADEEPFDIQWRTLICNVNQNSERINSHKDFCTSYKAFRKCVLVDEGIATTEEMTAARLFQEVFYHLNLTRIFGSTSSGYAGIFPRLSRKDDVIAVLDGGEFPFILRSMDGEENTNYELVGQCYIHGLMEPGQLKLDDPKYVKQDIFLH